MNSPFVANPAPATSPPIAFGIHRTLVCFSHLRWDFVFQRPQHLMTRFARDHTVIYWEEPLPAADGESTRLEIRTCPHSGVVIATPRLSREDLGDSQAIALRRLLADATAGATAQGPLIRWYYTPMMLQFSRGLEATCTVYDCMDELANFKFAPIELVELERELLSVADVVFTGGWSLWEAKRDRHPNIHPFPSSVDYAHFAKARKPQAPPADQADIPEPRLGYFGVIDERMDLDLLAAIADARADWSLVVVGPVVKIDLAALPVRPNLHYLGAKSYDELPAYLSGWDVALMPFAINEATRFISPTKTPEYLAGGRPVVSTPIADVARHFGDFAGVTVAADTSAFIEGCEAALALPRVGAWRQEADAALALSSWDATFARMRGHVDKVMATSTPSQAWGLTTVVGRSDRQARAYDYLIVGAGFAGSILAERLTSQLGKRVLLIDRRPHIGGNAFDEHNAAGVLMHRYGPHIFHTNSEDVFSYLSQFTKWRPYEHRVLANVREGQRVPIPINRTTLNALYGLSLGTDQEAEAFLLSRAEPVPKIRTSEDVVVSQVGRELYETFFRGYTRKQWGMDPSELDKSVTARVPTRTNVDDRYFTDRFQAMPAEGYTRMFERMLDNPGITLETGVTFEDIRAETIFDHLIFTGPIDEYFDYCYGKLPYRSLAFRHETLNQPWFQEVGTVNYPDETTPYTRISEYKHLTGQVSDRTTITYEYPQAEGDPYYPVPQATNQALFKRYEALAMATPNVSFVGRLATYRYYNMDQVAGQALATFRRLAARQVRVTTEAPSVSALTG